MDATNGLDTLLDLDGVIIAQERGYWVKFEAHRIAPSRQIPHGISYSLTLHDNHNQRIMGFDNAHAPKGGRRKRFQGRVVEYDHHHQDQRCKGVAKGLRWLQVGSHYVSTTFAQIASQCGPFACQTDDQQASPTQVKFAFLSGM